MRLDAVGWCVFLAATAATAAEAADISQSLGGEVAVVGAAARDDLLVPLATGGGGLSLGVEYLGRLGPGALDVAARLGLTVGADRLGATALSLEHGLGIRYYFPVGSTGAWRLAAGPAIGADADFFYFGDWDDSHQYWMGARWLGAAGRAWRPIGDGWRLAMAGELGIVGLVSRPPEYRRNNQDPVSLGHALVDVYDDPEAAWIGNWQLARARLEVSRSGGDSLVTPAWRFGVEVRLARAQDPEQAFALGVKLVLAKAWGW